MYRQKKLRRKAKSVLDQLNMTLEPGTLQLDAADLFHYILVWMSDRKQLNEYRLQLFALFLTAIKLSHSDRKTYHVSYSFVG